MINQIRVSSSRIGPCRVNSMLVYIVGHILVNTSFQLVSFVILFMLVITALL